MAIIKAKALQGNAVGRMSEGGDQYLRATRDGALFTTDWKAAGVMEGRGFMMKLGALSTPITGGGAGGTVIDIDCPEVCIGVPSGTSILPMLIDVATKPVPGAADDDEIDILVAVDQDKMNASSAGTSTAATIYNMNTLSARASTCYANTAYSATYTDPVLDLELAHVQKIFEMHSSTGVIWLDAHMHYEPQAPLIINGPAMLLLYFGGTKAVYGFATISWLEYPTAYFA